MCDIALLVFAHVHPEIVSHVQTIQTINKVNTFKKSL